jgi:hypothetical protein
VFFILTAVAVKSVSKLQEQLSRAVRDRADMEAKLRWAREEHEQTLDRLPEADELRRVCG